jgi:hypothetical protein
VTPASRLAKIRRIMVAAATDDPGRWGAHLVGVCPCATCRIYRLTVTPKPRRARKGRKP